MMAYMGLLSGALNAAAGGESVIAFLALLA